MDSAKAACEDRDRWEGREADKGSDQDPKLNKEKGHTPTENQK